MEILEIKSSINQIKNLQENITTKLEEADKIISGINTRFMKCYTQKVIKITKMKYSHNLQGLWNTIKRPKPKNPWVLKKKLRYKEKAQKAYSYKLY
jgi:hypothetical protein